MADRRVRVGVSSCLLGNEVRYDGGHKHEPIVMDLLAARFELVVVCPEVEVGMGVPREPIHLVAAPGGVRLLGVSTRTDHTDAMLAWSARRIRELEALDLGGYVFKKDSPSCGVFGVVGLFARTFREALPHIPVEEEDRLRDARLREIFFERVLAYESVKARLALR